MNNKIDKILAEEIKDSCGDPTIKVTVWSNDIFDSFAVPSGASTGLREAHELRDGDGKGVRNVVKKINNVIAKALVGQNIFNQGKIDRTMIKLDGTPNKDNLGGNAMVGVSIACAKLAAKASGVETYQYLRTLRLGSGQAQAKIKSSRKVPFLFLNLLEGGKHAKNKLAFQEYHIVPQTENIREAVEIGIGIDNTLKEIIKKELSANSVVLGDEGGFMPETSDVKKPLFYLNQAIKQNNLKDKARLSLDVAASSFFESNSYKINDKNISRAELMGIYYSLIKEFNLFSIEDPFEQEDFDSFRELKENHEGLLIVGDDLTVSNKMLLQKAIDRRSINAIIIKPNQIGTLTETLETMQLARENNIEIIVSHRGKETEDDFIADLAYAFGCFGFKAGAPTRPERMVKYQRLIKIAELSA
ncbi:hypothetical protein A3A95_04130 [Candidatus Nomurabacteria bacterium RIFCSPLOWO2_01_FULL_39_18]|uniref:Enolase n=1 Tax=Candidatus Nomurabacteria bacterium RIFCSPHIGHO2_01_FULL_40_24b TaxID=1801739 RepID=A0A1F6V5Z4_9BACT|nr:MAG: hypothetical protein A2647_04390 [Candidatus Nomurabacteria bacterium RIFCSPHIGHO2_01_FULL_40_24b]OGI89287.1 MAG: hypothetical protein A3A95_04130 [Candidatus Nomurabacteria bacterium RIFCSPLOWO2_01_FULL_39_18]